MSCPRTAESSTSSIPSAEKRHSCNITRRLLRQGLTCAMASRSWERDKGNVELWTRMASRFRKFSRLPPGAGFKSRWLHLYSTTPYNYNEQRPCNHLMPIRSSFQTPRLLPKTPYTRSNPYHETQTTHPIHTYSVDVISSPATHSDPA